MISPGTQYYFDPYYYWNDVSFKLGNNNIIGASIFKKMKIEISNTNEELIFHFDTLPRNIEDYSELTTIFNDGLIYIYGLIEINNHQISDWFLFDTGASGSIYLESPYKTILKLSEITPYAKVLVQGGNNVSSEMNAYELKLTIPVKDRQTEIRYTHTKTKAFVRNDTSKKVRDMNIIGSDLLINYDYIIDYANQKVYVKIKS